MSRFEQNLQPPPSQNFAIGPEGGAPINLAMEGMSFLTSLWAWVASGYVVIPCDVSGGANDIVLTPRLRADIGSGGYAQLLTFSFVAGFDTTGATTIAVSNGKDLLLDALPVYVDASAAGGADILAGAAYFAVFCQADSSLGLPDRMVRK